MNACSLKHTGEYIIFRVDNSSSTFIKFNTAHIILVDYDLFNKMLLVAQNRQQTLVFTILLAHLQNYGTV